MLRQESQKRQAAGSLLDRRFLDVIELRKIAAEIRVALRLSGLLRRAVPVRRAFPVAAVELVHNIHALAHRPERREAFGIQPRVVRQIDKHLRGARVRTAGGESKRAALVTLLHWRSEER